MQVSHGYLVTEPDVGNLVTLSFYWPPTCVNGVGRRTDDSVESYREDDWKCDHDQTAKAEAEPGVVAVSVLQANVIALQMKMLVRIQYKCLVPIYLFPQKQLRGLVISKTELHCSVTQCPHSCICEWWCIPSAYKLLTDTWM
jgi:hypothetical protein